jgi:hypothetical protein
LAAQFSFGKDNKATSVKVRARKLRYQYKGNKTLVTDEGGDTTTMADPPVTTSTVNQPKWNANYNNIATNMTMQDDCYQSVIHNLAMISGATSPNIKPINSFAFINMQIMAMYLASRQA